MAEVNFRYLEKKFPEKAEEFITDQEMLVLFLNSPVKQNWMKIMKLSEKQIKSINKIIDYYAGLKIEKENELKPKTREEIMHIEDDCLKKIFIGRILRFKNLKDRLAALRMAKNLLEQEYKNCIIFDPFQLEKLSVLSGADGTKRRFPTDFLVFDEKNKKIISIDVIVE